MGFIYRIRLDNTFLCHKWAVEAIIALPVSWFLAMETKKNSHSRSRCGYPLLGLLSTFGAATLGSGVRKPNSGVVIKRNARATHYEQRTSCTNGRPCISLDARLPAMPCGSLKTSKGVWSNQNLLYMKLVLFKPLRLQLLEVTYPTLFL